MFRRLRGAALIRVLCWTLVLNSAQTAAQVRLVSGWVREPPPVDAPVAAYLELSNHASEPRLLTGVRSPQAGGAELHEMREHGGVLRMRRLESLEIPAGGILRLQPGGAHVMLFGLPERPRAGAMLTLYLEFSDGDCLEVSLPVVPSSGR